MSILADLYLLAVSLLKACYLGECLGLCSAGLLYLYPAQLLGNCLQGLRALGMSVCEDRTVVVAMMVAKPCWRTENSTEAGEEDEKLMNE